MSRDERIHDIPAWLWDMLILMYEREEEHGQPGECLEPFLAMVPFPVKMALQGAIHDRRLAKARQE